MCLGGPLSDVIQQLDMWLVYNKVIQPQTTEYRYGGAMDIDMDGNKATLNLDGKHQLNHSTVYKSAKSTR